MSPVNVNAIGAYIREQREQAKISLRQLAQSAGISNPYLSQIERGLRRPSADILQQIAKGLRISAEALYVQAGFLEDRPPGSVVRDAVLTDAELTERQKQMLIEIYESFRKQTAMAMAADAAEIVDDQTGLDPDEAALVWPDDRSPAAIAAYRRLAIAAEPHDRGPEQESEPESAHGQPGHIWAVPTTDPKGSEGWETSAAGPDASWPQADEADGEDDDEDPEGPGGTIHQFPPPAGTR
jgi:transcriptional regulator with XRE-family HTH domain